MLVHLLNLAFTFLLGKYDVGCLGLTQKSTGAVVTQGRKMSEVSNSVHLQLLSM